MAISVTPDLTFGGNDVFQSTSVNFPIPSGITAGMLLLVSIVFKNNNTTVTITGSTSATPWTSFGTVGGGQTTFAFYKIADAGDAADSATGGLNWTINCDSGFVEYWAAAAWSGVDSTTPFATGPGFSYVPSMVFPSQTAPSTSAVWVGLYLGDPNSNAPTADPISPVVNQDIGSSPFSSGTTVIYSATGITGAFAPTGTETSGYSNPAIAFFLNPASGGGGGSTLTAAQGSYALTGEPAAFAVKLVSAQGSYALTGEPAGLKATYSAAQGAYTLTGEPAALGPGLVSAQGSYTLTGEPAAFKVVLTAAQGSYALTGIAATLTATGGSSLTASQGSFTLTGEPAGLDPGLVSAQGAFALTGEPAAFKTVLTSAQGSYTLTGEPAALMPSLVSAQGSYALTGEASAFSVTLGAAQGSYALTGIAATLSVTGNQTLTAAQGSYALTGEPAGFRVGLTSAQGGYTLTGEAATGTATANGTLTANTGHYVLTGIAAELTASGFVTPIPTMKPYQPRAYPQIVSGIPMWHTDQNNQISASVASMIQVIKDLDARLRTGGL